MIGGKEGSCTGSNKDGERFGKRNDKGGGFYEKGV